MRTGVRGYVGVVVGMAMAAAGAVPVWADDPGVAGDKAELQVLRARLDKLEEKVALQEASAAGAEPGNAVLNMPSGLSGVGISGFVDTIYSYNFNEANNRLSAFRVFDTRAGDFMINNAQINLDKAVSPESPVGFKTELMFGTDAEVVGGVTTGLGVTTNEVELQEGYVEYLAPVGNGLDVKVGKFATLNGAEVIESKDNWNISRSFLFGYAIPFTHTGVRTTYPWTEMLSTVVGISNGWDVVDDNNKAKTLEFGAMVTPLDGLSIAGTYMVGAEQGGNGHDSRHLLDLVATYQPTDALTLKLNTDIAREEDVVSATGGGNATWNGLAAYARYALNEQAAISGRWEIFNDNDGVRTAINVAGTSPTGSGIADAQFMSYTLTGEYKLHKHLIGRVEYRLDTADSALFRHDQGFENYQNTVAFELIAPF